MSITLTTPQTIVFNGVSVENDPSGAATKMIVDFIGNTATFEFNVGNVVGSPPNLNIGTFSKVQRLVVDLTSGHWVGDPQPTAQNQNPPQISGTVPPNALNNFNNQVKGDRNVAETFAAGANNIQPGTQVPWT